MFELKATQFDHLTKEAEEAIDNQESMAKAKGEALKLAAEAGLRRIV